MPPSSPSRPSSSSSSTCSGACSRDRRRATIPGKQPRWSGQRRRHRRTTISVATPRWFITVRTSTACRARRVITSCRPIRLLFRRTRNGYGDLVSDSHAQEFRDRPRRPGCGTARARRRRRRQPGRERVSQLRSPLAPVRSIPGVSVGEERRVPWLGITVVLGLGFLLGQWLAWRELHNRGFDLPTSASSSFVYLLTGVHAVHLAGGIIALLYAASAGALFRKPIEVRRIAVDATAWYWHFMAFLWIYIFVLLEIAR